MCVCECVCVSECMCVSVCVYVCVLLKHSDHVKIMFFLLKNTEQEITLWVQNGTFPATDLWCTRHASSISIQRSNSQYRDKDPLSRY